MILMCEFLTTNLFSHFHADTNNICDIIQTLSSILPQLFHIWWLIVNIASISLSFWKLI